MIKKILIANRGEIACRVMRTARRMGIKTVAVYSEADKGALHVDMADESVCIGPAASSESYLSARNIMAAIKKTGADAVHPGYGFLSENAAFVRKLDRAGVIFIGPRPRAVTAMGDKIESKKLALKAGVNVVPGHAEVLKDVGAAQRIAKKIGYPVMLKASAGGGGKGMRIARNAAELKEGFVSAAREAITSFGDDRLFVEKYIENPRHIEIQIIADNHGNIVYLGERECSIQRRHQKIIEEAPSPFLDEKTRQAMGEQAVALSRAVKYCSAGTVEFIVDTKRNFYFLEMNTRLQVEHPVTEMITGVDLVELMIHVAAGKKLPFSQDDIRLDGWAIESRIYSEDPLRNFLPSIGRLNRYVEPPLHQGSVRVDSGVIEGDEVSVHYDPMIAKLIAHGSDRNQAVQRMGEALDGFIIRGVSHNIGFLAAVMAHPRFIAGNLSTAFIEEEYPDGFKLADVVHETPALLVAVAASIHHVWETRAARISGQHCGHERKVPGDWTVIYRSEEYPVSIRLMDDGFDVSVDGDGFVISTDWTIGDALFTADINGKACSVQVERNGIAYRLQHAGVDEDLLVLSPHIASFNKLMLIKSPPDMSRYILSPMPGLLISVAVTPGQKVKAGDEMAIVEAMKMENILKAERDGTVSAVHAAAGDSLSVNQPIIELE